ITVGHLLQIENCYRTEKHTGEFRVLFFGSDNPINIDGLHYLMRQVWPGVVAGIPAARLILAGALSEFGSEYEGITRLGFLDDVRTAYREADVVINPVQQGTGLNIKT